MKTNSNPSLIATLSSVELESINGGRRGRGADDPAGHVRRGRGQDDPQPHA